MSGSTSSYRTRRSRSALFAVVALLAVGMSAYGMDLLGPAREVAAGPAILPFAAEGAGGGAVAVKVRVALLKGQAAGRVAGEFQGQKTTYDTAAGLTTVLGPDEASIERVFGNALRTATQVIGLGTTPGGGMATWAAPQVELLWPEGRPQYYLEPAGQDLYRRVELADKEGYVVTVRPTGVPPQLTVAVEFAKNTLTGGTYDDTIRGFVGRPVLVKTLVTPTVPLTRGERVLLLWHPPARLAAVAGPRATLAPAYGWVAPPWAVGDWDMTGPGEEYGCLSVKADGTVIWTSGMDRAAARKNEPPLMFGPGSVNPAGQVQIDVRLGGEKMQLSGRLSPDGTATGGVEPQGIAWTAKRVAEAVPAWAVGAWEITAPPKGQEGVALMIVNPNGDVVFRVEEADPPVEIAASGLAGKKPIGPSGEVRFELSHEGEVVASFTGTLSRDGTGSGTSRPHEGHTEPWTAKRVGGPAAAEQASELDLQLSLAADRLARFKAGHVVDLGRQSRALVGVAVLLELETQGQRKASDAACLKNLKQLSVACHMYADDHDGQLPTAADPAEFRKQILPYLRNNDALLVCPAAPDEPGYVFNPALAGKSINDVLHPQAAPMIWDAGARPGGIQPVPGTTTGRHNGGDNVAFVDGSCRRLTAGAIAELATELAGKASAGKRR